MRKLVIFLMVNVLALGSVAWASEPPATPKFDKSALSIILEIQNVEEPSLLINRVDDAVNHLLLKQPRYKKAEDFAEYVYYFVHKKFLRDYQEFSSIDNTIAGGEYDCLTGTAMYSFFFTELGIPFSVVENNFHIYLLLYPGTENEILLETTDPRHGFVKDSKTISHLKQEYAKRNYQGTARVKLDMDVDKTLKGYELVGLLLYNQSVKNVNLGKIDQALELAEKSLEYYSGERITKLIKWLNAEKLYASL